MGAELLRCVCAAGARDFESMSRKRRKYIGQEAFHRHGSYCSRVDVFEDHMPVMEGMISSRPAAVGGGRTGFCMVDIREVRLVGAGRGVLFLQCWKRWAFVLGGQQRRTTVDLLYGLHVRDIVRAACK